MKFKCGICGYIYDDAENDIPFEELPEDWTCPVCGAPKSVFEPVEDNTVNEEKKTAAETVSASKKYKCGICGYIYDDAENDIPFEELPEDWTCPVCGAPKSVFEEIGTETEKPAAPAAEKYTPDEDMELMGAGELSALFSNLARGCEKQYQEEARANFQTIADYFKGLVPEESSVDTAHLAELIKNDIDRDFAALRAEAEKDSDRGMLRAVTWGEKVSKMAQSLINRYIREGDAFLENTGVYICTVCGFIFIGDNPPEICPVCKVPGWKFKKIDGRIK